MTTKVTVDATNVDRDVNVATLAEAGGDAENETVVSSGDCKEFFIHDKQCLVVQESFTDTDETDGE